MKKGNYRIPAYLLVLLNVLGFLLLYTANNFDNGVLYVGGGLLGLFVVVYSILVLCRMGDKFLFLIASMLISIGVLMLCRIDLYKGLKQIMWIGLGCVVFFMAYAVYYKIRFWNRLWFL